MSRKRYGKPTARLIYPELQQSEQIRELAKDPIHLLLWYALFHGVDDQGRMEARVSTIQANCLGHLPEDAIKPRVVQEALTRMRQIQDEDGIPLVYIYDANGTKVLQLAKWWEYQGGMRNAWPSRWDPMPGWSDEVRGHGKKALEEIIESRSGDFGVPNGGTAGGRQDTDSTAYKQKQKHNEPNGSSGPRPWDLFAAMLEERGISHEDYPGPRIQLNHAKRMLADNFTVEEVREATRAFMQDPFWSTKGFDLSAIHVHWGKMKAQRKAPPPKRSRKAASFDDS